MESKHLKGQLGPRVGDVTFFIHGGQLGACVGDVTFFNHVGQLGPCVGDVTFFNHVGQLGPHVDDVTSTHEKPTKNMKNWFAWFFKVVSWFFMVFGWFPWFFKVVSWFIMVFGWFPWFCWLRTPQNSILAQRYSLGLAGRRPALA